MKEAGDGPSLKLPDFISSNGSSRWWTVLLPFSVLIANIGKWKNLPAETDVTRNKIGINFSRILDELFGLLFSSSNELFQLGFFKTFLLGKQYTAYGLFLIFCAQFFKLFWPFHQKLSFWWKRFEFVRPRLRKDKETLILSRLRIHTLPPNVTHLSFYY